MDKPVHGWELEDIAAEQNLKIQPGDAMFVYSGREKYAADNGGTWMKTAGRPGLHASCLPFIKKSDISILGWDMMDAAPNEYDVPWSVHGAIFAYGVALIDNALLEPLSVACRQEGRYEFMVTINPLYVKGGTGSPTNPIAVF
jgi:kynurenine formamidase